MSEKATVNDVIDVIVATTQLYAPVVNGYEVVGYWPEIPVDGKVGYTLKLNGQSGHQEGFLPYAPSDNNPAMAVITPPFLETWRGDWPVVVDIVVSYPGYTFGPASFTLYNPVTDLLPAVKVEWNFHESRTVQIPKEGEEDVIVIANANFYDRNGTQLPFAEPSVWQYSVEWTEPYEGITRNKHLFFVSSQAKPGVVRLVAKDSTGYTSYSAFFLV